MTDDECRIAFFISGHGFGHASRQIEIINALHRRRPDLSFLIRSEIPRRLFDRTVNPPFDLDARSCDTGVVQIDALHPDVRATIDRAREFYGAAFDARVDVEARLLRERRVTLVVADAPPLACAAAHRAGIPSVVISNFTWDWIYEEYREYLGDAPSLIPTIHAAYAHAREAWRLPMHGGFEAFKTIRDVPFVARHARPDRDRRDVLCDLVLPFQWPVALVSFGGYGVDRLPETLDCLSDWTVITTSALEKTSRAGSIHVLNEQDIYDSGLRYEDLVASCDVVVSKPGYGIISECIANDTALVYTERGRFAEYPVLVSEMPKYLRCAYLDQASLLAGRWRSALAAAVNAAAPPEHPRTDGADVIAGMMSALCSLDETSSGPPPRL